MKFFPVVFLSSAFMLAAFSASAQEIIGIQEQIDSLKEEMIILQRKVYRDNTDANLNLPTSSTAAVKLGEYDEVIRTMNGKIDEMEHKIKTLEEKINTMNNDFDVRFKLLEGKPIAAGQSSLNTPKKFDAAIVKGAPKSVTGGDVTTGELKSLEPAQENLSVEDLYKTGLEALKSGNSTVAERHFTEILDHYGTDKLAGNAQYWLGETYYVNKDFSKAAVAFGKGYQNYKDGAKGADSLLKLGLSMAQLGKKSEACSAFTNLAGEFPKADKSIKDKAAAEAKKLGCQ